jgi:hypothetical protein
MGWLSSILHQFGPTGNIIALFGSTLGLFIFIENMSSKQARDDFTKYLKSTDIATTVVRLPKDTRVLFERVFGPRHFSLRCVIASVLFSIVATVGVYGFVVLNDPSLLGIGGEPRFLASISAWVFWSFVPDYFNLLKTRVALRIITTRQIRASVLIVILFADLLIGYAIFRLTFWPVFMFAMDVEEHGLASVLRVYSYSPMRMLTLHLSWKSLFSFSSLDAVFFLPGMVPSIWLWFYVAATLTVRLAVRAAPLFRFSMYLFDIDQHPIRSVGIVAASLVSGVYVIFLVISKFAQVLSA